MTNEEILKKAIEKAMDNGFNLARIQSCTIWFWHEGEQGGLCLVIDHSYTNQEGKRMGKCWHFQTNEVIFTHDFVKAFWGEEMRPEVDMNGNQVGFVPIWKIYFQQMVLEEEPLKYIEKFLI